MMFVENNNLRNFVMFVNDQVSCMLTQIRNGYAVNKDRVTVNNCKINSNILEVFFKEGYIRNYKKSSCGKSIEVMLKYYENQSVISELSRVSKPSKRIYKSSKELRRFKNGLGLTILSTSKGILSGEQAIKLNVGGEVICNIY
jgi:small subunit ribosomal protein S8